MLFPFIHGGEFVAFSHTLNSLLIREQGEVNSQL